MSDEGVGCGVQRVRGSGVGGGRGGGELRVCRLWGLRQGIEVRIDPSRTDQK